MMNMLKAALLVLIFGAISNAYGGHCGTDHSGERVQVSEKTDAAHEGHEKKGDHEDHQDDEDHQDHEGHDH
ncbi:MAG: hypothetical protein CMK44_03485 [Porticoccus sp.]|nr:hypothetical protein [Porticoccus sp.]